MSSVEGVNSPIELKNLLRVAVGCPHESLSKEHMTTFVYGPVTGEALTQMRVKANLVATGPPSTKSNRMEDS